MYVAIVIFLVRVGFIHVYRAHVICYIMCRSPGRIVETVLEDITELNGGGLLSVTVQNTGSVSAEYSVI